MSRSYLIVGSGTLDEVVVNGPRFAGVYEVDDDKGVSDARVVETADAGRLVRRRQLQPTQRNQGRSNGVGKVQGRNFLFNFPVTAKIGTSGHQTLECFIATLPT